VFLRASGAPLHPAGSVFAKLKALGFYPEWQNKHAAELLPAAYETALRTAAQLQQGRAAAEDLPELAQTAAVACRSGIAYCHSWLQAQQARLSAADAEQLLSQDSKCYTSLASTVLKLAVVDHAAQEQRRQSVQNALGLESTENFHLRILLWCQTFAACAFEVSQNPTDRCSRWTTFCLPACLPACLPPVTNRACTCCTH